MKQKMVLIITLAILLAACAKLIEPGSPVSPIGAPPTLGPIASPALNAPTIAPTIEPTVPSIDSPLPTPFQSPLAMPEFVSPVATPQP